MKKIQLVLDSAHVQRLDLLCQAYGLAARDVVSQLLDGAVVALAERINREQASAPEASDGERDQDHQGAAATSESPSAQEAGQ